MSCQLAVASKRTVERPWEQPLGAPPEALQALFGAIRAIAADADNATAYCGRCRLKSELGLHEEAIKDCDELISLDPDSQ